MTWRPQLPNPSSGSCSRSLPRFRRSSFRGYLQRQFEARTRSPLIAIAGQAELFGVTHGYRGGMLMLRIAILGIIFGLAAWACKSVISCIVAHFALDVASGLGLFR